MTDTDYEYECSRAELLGIPKPSKDEFLARQREAENNAVEGEIEEINPGKAEVMKSLN